MALRAEEKAKSGKENEVGGDESVFQVKVKEAGKWQTVKVQSRQSLSSREASGVMLKASLQLESTSWRGEKEEGGRRRRNEEEGAEEDERIEERAERSAGRL